MIVDEHDPDRLGVPSRSLARPPTVAKARAEGPRRTPIAGYPAADVAPAGPAYSQAREDRQPCRRTIRRPTTRRRRARESPATPAARRASPRRRPRPVRVHRVERPGGRYTGPRLDARLVVGRTFDTFGREWSLFLVLAVPAAVVSLLQLLITPTFEAQVQAQSSAAGAAPTDPWALFVVSVIVATGVGISALASVVAADRLWRGEPAGIRDAFGGRRAQHPRGDPDLAAGRPRRRSASSLLTTQLTSIAPTGRPTAVGARSELSRSPSWGSAAARRRRRRRRRARCGCRWRCR